MENSTHLCPGVDSLTKEDVLKLVKEVDKDNPYRKIAGNIEMTITICYIDETEWHDVGSLDEFNVPSSFCSIMFYYVLGNEIFNFFVISVGTSPVRYTYQYNNSLENNFRQVLTRKKLETFLSE